MEAKIENCLQKNIPWIDLPDEIRKALGQKHEYDNKILDYSIKNQLRYVGNLVRLVKISEMHYYKKLLQYSSDHLMLFPYHLSDFIVSAMRVTPFQYYIKIIQNLLSNEKSYDTLPNFTAADCLRLLGIGRNQYLDLMNQHRASKKFFMIIKKINIEILPQHPVKDILIEPWWIINSGYITEDDIKYSTTEKQVRIIDLLVSEQNVMAGSVNQDDVRALYLKGLIYLDVPINDDDLIVVPPLEGFVMNRVTGDYFETLLYKIFISIDERTTVRELAEMLNIKINLVKNAISMYCRLGFAYKKSFLNPDDFDISWHEMIINSKFYKNSVINPLNDSELIKFINSAGEAEELFDNFSSLETSEINESSLKSPTIQSSTFFFSNNSLNKSVIQRENSLTYNFLNTNHNEKRIGLLYDSTLAAFLMMGNLSSNLKTHAVTMFEAGKLTDECLDSLLFELNKIKDTNLGEQGFEAEKYFLHAILLCKTIQFLRKNPKLSLNETDNTINYNGLGLDLIRCESLLNLEQEISQKFLYKNYAVLFSLSPLSNETKIIDTYSTNFGVPHFGISSSTLNSIWFKLFIYEKIKFGPPSLLLTRGFKLSNFPMEIFGDFENLLITPLNKDSLVVSIGNSLETINDYLHYSAILVQGYPNNNTFFNTNNSNNGNSSNLSLSFEGDNVFKEQKEIVYVSLPIIKEDEKTESTSDEFKLMQNHPAIIRLNKFLNLESVCGFIRLIKHDSYNCFKSNEILEFEKSDSNSLCKEDSIEFIEMSENFSDWTILDCCFGIPLFNRVLNKTICDKIQKANLCDRLNLDKVLKINLNLNQQLNEFLNYYTNEFPFQDKSDKDWMKNQMFLATSDFQKIYPTCNLLYYNGKITKFTK